MACTKDFICEVIHEGEVVMDFILHDISSSREVARKVAREWLDEMNFNDWTSFRVREVILCDLCGEEEVNTKPSTCASCTEEMMTEEEAW